MAAQPGIKRSQIARIEWVMAAYHRRVAHAALLAGRRRVVVRAIRYFSRIHLSVGDAHAFALRAALAFRDGREAEGERLIMDAIRVCDEAGFRCQAAACRYRLGEHIKGDEGEQLRADALELFRGFGAGNPKRLLDFCGGLI